MMPHRTNDFARAFYDAIAAGLPVIAYRTENSEGTIRDGVDGLLVTRDNVIALALAIVHLHEDRPLLIKMAHAARRRALIETQEIWHRLRKESIDEMMTNVCH